MAQSNRIVGRAPAVFIFDFRGLPIGDLASEVKLVTRAHPAAELLVVADARESAVFLRLPADRGRAGQADVPARAPAADN